ncbi:hypothetical protein H6P81_016686 [Aristolochia fimbriata]|uniref:Uncharacterized protein n=1 Tax=Aristolochia fimbriata TaxID=158543 RepID=A0AAV7EBX7_ARIFI|nr:hypothetical protein H6P81_016686 [Aristolochia fimbriata]
MFTAAYGIGSREVVQGFGNKFVPISSPLACSCLKLPLFVLLLKLGSKSFSLSVPPACEGRVPENTIWEKEIEHLLGPMRERTGFGNKFALVGEDVMACVIFPRLRARDIW